MGMIMAPPGQRTTSNRKCGTADHPYLGIRAGGSRSATEKSNSNQAEGVIKSIDPVPAWYQV